MSQPSVRDVASEVEERFIRHRQNLAEKSTLRRVGLDYGTFLEQQRNLSPELVSALMSEYQGVVGKVLAGFEPAIEAGSEPEVVAEVIYEAATDGTDQLRYTAGADAAEYVAQRKAVDDATFRTGMKARFGL